MHAAVWIFDDDRMVHTSEKTGRAVIRGAHPSRVLVVASRRDGLPASITSCGDDRRRWAAREEVRFGGTPKPTPGTGVFPGAGGTALPAWHEPPACQSAVPVSGDESRAVRTARLSPSMKDQSPHEETLNPHE